MPEHSQGASPSPTDQPDDWRQQVDSYEHVLSAELKALLSVNQLSGDKLVDAIMPIIRHWLDTAWLDGGWDKEAKLEARAPEREAVNLAFAANAMIEAAKKAGPAYLYDSATDFYRLLAKACADTWGLITDDDNARQG